MKATEQFAKVIGEYIEKAKQEDELFAQCVDSQPTKTVEGCVNYILKTVKDSGVAGWTDEEVYGMARHFYDEKDLKDPGSIGGRVVINRQVELTADEKAKAREKAMADFEKAEREKLEKKAKADRERAIKREKDKTAALLEKRERESKMQLDLFGGMP